jgi:hypothetical protein
MVDIEKNDPIIAATIRVARNFLFMRRKTTQEERKMKDSLIYFSLALSESVVKAAMNAS